MLFNPFIMKWELGGKQANRSALGTSLSISDLLSRYAVAADRMTDPPQIGRKLFIAGTLTHSFGGTSSQASRLRRAHVRSRDAAIPIGKSPPFGDKVVAVTQGQICPIMALSGHVEDEIAFRELMILFSFWMRTKGNFSELATQ